MRSDNGPEFIADAIKDWLKTAGVTTAYIPPGKPWHNGKDESFDGKLREVALHEAWQVHRSWVSGKLTRILVVTAHSEASGVPPSLVAASPASGRW